MLQQVQEEKDRMESLRRANQSKTQASKIDHLLKSASCMVAFNGWKNLQELRKVSLTLRENGTQTRIKNVHRLFDPQEITFR